MDREKANSFINKHIIIGISIVDEQENLIEQYQLHGDIIKINENEGIVVLLNNSLEEYTLPPDLSAIKDAPEGDYHFRSTGEIVVNPDLMTSWTIYQNPNNNVEVEDDETD